MKGKFLQKYHRLLVDNRVEEFENKLVNQFLSHSSKLFSLHYSYLDWLVLKLRPTRYSSISSLFLNTDYIKLNSFSMTEEKREFILMLQFLSYAKLLDFEIEVLSGIPYRVFQLRLDHFLKFQNSNLKSTNYYQLKKVRQTLENLQSNLFVTHFSDTDFQRLVAIFRISITKNKKLKSCWIGKVWLIDELFYYQYPFFLPDFFQQKMKKDEFEV